MPDSPILVLDTNVALDAFLFQRDPLLDPLRRAVRDGSTRVVSTPWALQELDYVLKLDKVPATAQRREEAALEFRRFVEIVELPAKTAPTPKCADRDDQEFIDLAIAIQATWLLSRDRKVLKLRRRFIKLELPTQIMSPLDWCAMISSRTDTTT